MDTDNYELKKSFSDHTDLKRVYPWAHTPAGAQRTPSSPGLIPLLGVGQFWSHLTFLRPEF